MIFAFSFTEWLGRMLGQENVQSIDRIDTSLAAPWAQCRAAPAWIFLGCAALCLLSFLFYLKSQPAGRLARTSAASHRKTRIALAVGRAGLLSLVFLILAEPIVILKLTSSPRPLLWVLFDGTESMAIEDELSESERSALEKAVGANARLARSSTTGTATAPNSIERTEATGNASPPSRMHYVLALIEKPDNNLLQRLEQKFQIKPFVFDRPDGVRSLDLGDDPLKPLDSRQLAEQLSTSGQVTALGSALSDLARRHASSSLAGLVVISDFDQNSGPAPLSPAQKLGVPIYTVGVGPKASVDLRVSLQADPKMKKAERKSLDVLLAQEGLEGHAVTVRLTALAKSAADMGPPQTIVIGEKQVTLNQPSQPVQFDYVPAEAGRFDLVAEVEPLEGEVISQNNRATREVTILDDFLRLMFVEYEPTWEWRFIKEVFHRDKLVGLRGFRTFLRSADPAVRQTNELFLPTMTPKRADFFAHDVIFLGDMPASTLSTRFCELTKEFVSKFGGGLVVLAGPRFGPGELAQTPLADMLPVVVDPDARLRDEREFALRLAPAAATVDFMRLGGSDLENDRAWSNLGPLPWYQPVARLHPLATSLAEHPSDTCVDGRSPQPLVAIRKYGRGEVVYLGFNETWRLRRKYGELYYRQFWGQMIHRLGLSHALGNQKRFVVQTDRQQYQADDKAIITVEAYDADFEPLVAEKLPERQLVAELVLPGKRSDGTPRLQPLYLPQRREGIFEAQVPVDLAGEHHVRVKDPVTGETQEIHFQVTSLSAERRSAVRNVALQEALAAETRGKAYDLTTVASLPDEVQLPRRVETSIKVVPIWNTWVVFALVMLLLFTEWLVRKMVSLP
jgi:hypothetical protein